MKNESSSSDFFKTFSFFIVISFFSDGLDTSRILIAKPLSENNLAVLVSLMA
jgi:hypothetical protein